MLIKGEAIKLGDNINTDLIIAGKYTKTLNMQDLANYVFEDLDISLKERIKGKIIVAGDDFGCGSSREQAPLAMKYSGVGGIIAKSYARIFFRNAINIGLPVLIADTNMIFDGYLLEINLETGLIINKVNGQLIQCTKLIPIMLEILKKGGLVEYLKENKNFIMEK